MVVLTAAAQGVTLPETRIHPTVTVRFGLFEVNFATGTMTRQGVRLKLQEQPFRILSLLLLQYGEIVSREQLRQALWPQGTHVNFEGSLNAALKKLRAALQDDAENPRFIETVPRQGYRFLAPVHVINEKATLVSPGQITIPNHGEKSIEVRLRMHPEFSPELASESDWYRQAAEI